MEILNKKVVFPFDKVKDADLLGNYNVLALLISQIENSDTISLDKDAVYRIVITKE